MDYNIEDEIGGYLDRYDFYFFGGIEDILHNRNYFSREFTFKGGSFPILWYSITENLWSSFYEE